MMKPDRGYFVPYREAMNIVLLVQGLRFGGFLNSRQMFQKSCPLALYLLSDFELNFLVKNLRQNSLG